MKEEAIKMTRNEDGVLVSEEIAMTISNGKVGQFQCLDERSNENIRVMRFELMDNEQLYNGVRFPKEALQHQVDVFNKKEFLVTHGMDHSWNVRDQLGKVMEMELKVKGDVATVFITSEHYKETPAQIDAETLFKQGLLDSISGGWRAGIAWNEETEEYEVYKPILREVSSTPVPAKTDAKKLENVCMALQNQISTTEKTAGSEEDIPLEELDMKDEIKTQDPKEPSPGEGKEEASAKIDTALNERQDTLEQEFADMKARQIATERTDLLGKAAELGLAETEFEGQPNAAIEFALQVANKVKMSTLRASDPDIVLGGEDQQMADGSPEMVDYLCKNIYRTDLAGD